MQGSRAGGCTKIQSFTKFQEQTPSPSCRWLGGLVEPQLMTSCPTLCRDHRSYIVTKRNNLMTPPTNQRGRTPCCTHSESRHTQHLDTDVCLRTLIEFSLCAGFKTYTKPCLFILVANY